MSFIATANPPSATQEPEIANDLWFPALSLVDVRATCRLDGTVTPARLRHALLTAMLSVNAELDAYRLEQQSRYGYTNLADVPSHKVAGLSAQVVRYSRAVCECLQADLAEAYRNIDTTPQTMGKEGRVGEALAIKVDEHRRNQRWAISDMLGIRRTTVELI